MKSLDICRMKHANHDLNSNLTPSAMYVLFVLNPFGTNLGTAYKTADILSEPKHPTDPNSLLANPLLIPFSHAFGFISRMLHGQSHTH